MPQDATKVFTKEQVESLRERRRNYRENWTPPVKAAPKTSKPLMSVPANHEVAGFMPSREEFDVEHENEAESVISALAFLDDDPPEERGRFLFFLFFFFFFFFFFFCSPFLFFSFFLHLFRNERIEAHAAGHLQLEVAQAVRAPGLHPGLKPHQLPPCLSLSLPPLSLVPCPVKRLLHSPHVQSFLSDFGVLSIRTWTRSARRKSESSTSAIVPLRGFWHKMSLRSLWKASWVRREGTGERERESIAGG